METQQSYKFLTDLGLAQYDATVRQYMEQTFAKKGETPSGSGVNVVEATIEPGEKEEDWKISEMSHTPDQIWDMFQTKQAVVIQGIVPEERSYIFFPIAFKDYTQGAQEAQEVPAVPQGAQGLPISGPRISKLIQKRMVFGIFLGDMYVSINFEEVRGDKWDSRIKLHEIESELPYEQINWQDLKARRDKGDLEPGKQYCIMDYDCTTNQCFDHNSNLPDTRSANHNFGIIITADDENTLNENAHAIDLKHEYFVGCNLNVWVLKYCIDNDTKRFPWADGGKITVTIDDKAPMFYFDKITSKGTYKWVNSSYPSNPIYTTTKNPDSSTRLYSDSQCQYDWNYNGYRGSISDVYKEGTGVIYWMQDEWGNEAPYDFKNILFDGIYTFSSYDIVKHENTDGSLTGVNFLTNIIKAWTNNGIPRNIFYGFHNPNQMANCGGWWDNQLGEDCTDNVFGVKGSTDSCSGYGNRIGRGCTKINFNRSCSNNNIGNDVESITFGNACQMNTIKDNCSYIGFKPYTRYVTVYEGTNGSTILPAVNVDYQQFIGIPNSADLKPTIITFGEGGSTGGNYKPLSVNVKIDERHNIQSVSSFRNTIYDAMMADQPIFMHVQFTYDTKTILFLELTKITSSQAIFSGWIDGIYHQCIIEAKLAQCSYKVIDEFGAINASIKDLDERVTALEGGEKPRYDVDLLYNEQTVSAIIEITGEEPPTKASGTTWTAQIVECNDFPELVGVELIGTGSDIESAKFTGTSEAGKPITANIKQYPKYTVSISNKDTGVDSNCMAELINTRQDKTEGWLYDMRTRECPEYPELVRDGFMLKNPMEDKIDNATGSFTTDKGEVLSLSIAIK